MHTSMKARGVYVKLERHMVNRILALKDLPAHWAEYRRPDGTMFVECDKAWYGHPAACSLFADDMMKLLTEECGYTRHSMVPCLYYRDIGGGVQAYIMVFVDDLGYLMPPDGAEDARVTAVLERRYGTLKKQDGDRVKYIGLEVFRNRDKNRFEVTMGKRAQKLAAKHGVTVAANNPARADGTFTERGGDSQQVPVDATEFRSLVMSERYLTYVMPECLFHTSFLATKQAAPTQKHWDDAIRVLAYMLGACSRPMLIYGYGKEPTLEVFGDAAYQIHDDSKSHSGIAVFLGNIGSSIHNTSSKQAIVTRSSCDSEIVTFESGTYVGAYFRNVLAELGIEVKMVIHWEDNESALYLVEHGTREYAKKRKHIVGMIHSAKEYIDDPDNGAVAMYCHTDMMTADACTKDLHGSKFGYHTAHMHGEHREN
jgi:hypothetical protein